uniref:Uncharacterized protein n=1 Tax=Mus musculus TaxID=10090 RepID=Q8C1V7_MOUSE|nr:unnamed protein product [Mus musculus]
MRSRARLPRPLPGGGGPALSARLRRPHRHRGHPQLPGQRERARCALVRAVRPVETGAKNAKPSASSLQGTPAWMVPYKPLTACSHQFCRTRLLGAVSRGQGTSGLRRAGGRNSPCFVLTPKVSWLYALTALALQALL